MDLRGLAAAVTEPVVICIYGASGVGKTVATGYAFPKALYLAAPGALNSIMSVCGYFPESLSIATIQEATEVIKQVGKNKSFKAVVIDDFSFMAEQTFASLEQKFSGFLLWGKLRDVALAFRDTSRYAGVHVVLSAWEQPPKRKPDGSQSRGGPQLAGKLPEAIPALCDVVLRAVYEPQRAPWPAAFRCSPDANWVMKDRFNVVPVIDPAPMNLGEILRASGFDLERLDENKGQEEEVEAISQGLEGVFQHDQPLLNEVYRGLIARGDTPERARWTVQDAQDRAMIRLERQLHNLTYFAMPNKPVLGG